MVGLAELAVDLQKRLDQLPLILDGRSVRHHFGHDLLQKAIVKRYRAAAKLLWKELVPKSRHRFVAGAVARHNFQRAVLGNVVREGKERKSEVRIAAGRVPGEKIRSRLDARNLSVRRNAIDHTLGAALVDVVLTGENLEARGIDVKDEIALLLRLVAPEESSPGMVRGANQQACRPVLDFVFLGDQLPEINRRRLLFPSAPESKQRRSRIGFLNQGNQLVFLLQ